MQRRWNGKCDRNYKWWSMGVCKLVAWLVVRDLTCHRSDKVVINSLWSGQQTWQSRVLDLEANTLSLMVSIFDFVSHTQTFRKTPLGEHFLPSAAATILLSCHHPGFCSLQLCCFNMQNTLAAKFYSEARIAWREISVKYRWQMQLEQLYNKK